jgi:hypothetical protein
MVYLFAATKCTPWSLPNPINGVKKCKPRAGGLTCIVKCSPGYQLIDAESVNTQFTCTVGGDWQPNAMVPECVPIGMLGKQLKYD